ncbi:PilW family protein [Curvibacter lanceolatus]|uniref:PilW family protein n=1 Tax=Curvibacter lanceolatus TaxID=86182 RepID=UPI0003A0CF52|nr:PilW family protein [Curvibacter lanceolatus]
MPLDLTPTQRQRVRGVTLVELMVALAVSMVVALAALAALNIARQGFTVNDSAAQLRENGRFVSDLLQRLVVQTGFKDLSYATTPRPTNVAGLVSNPPPAIYGLNNRSRVSTDAWDAGTAWTSGATGYGSDILVLRFQPSSNSSTATAADGSMINCNGESLTTLPTNRDDRAISILHVGTDSDGEPSLMCSSIPVNSSTVTQTTLVRGVENFQVLYGVDGIAPGNTSTTSPSTAPNLPDRYLRADQLTVSNLAASYFNWRRVRSVRIGLVLRSPPGQSPDVTSATFLPFGVGKSSSTAADGSAFASTDDPGTTASENTFTDTRFRRAVTFTIHLRNDQGS